MDVFDTYYLLLSLNALGFLTILAYEDLKTSLVDDRHILGMAAVALIIHIVFAILLKTWIYLAIAIAALLIFLGIGYVLYFLGQWGEGDSLILGALFFSLPFPKINSLYLYDVINYWIVFMFIIVIVGVVYSLTYAAIYSLFKPSYYKQLYIKIKNHKKENTVFFIGIMVLSATIYILSFNLIESIKFFIIATLAWMAFYFAYYADRILFIKRIPIYKVKEGDTVYGNYPKAKFDGSKLDAITQDQINAIIKHYGKNTQVIVKDLVRYVPTFLIATIIILLEYEKIYSSLIKLFF